MGRQGSKSALAILATGLLMAIANVAAARVAETPKTNVTVVVKDAETAQPISQAHLTLQFDEKEGRLSRTKHIAFSAKTNPQGRYKFTFIPMGTIRLIVTADRHQTFSKDFEITQPNQVIEVKLKKPQPVL